MARSKVNYARSTANVRVERCTHGDGTALVRRSKKWSRCRHCLGFVLNATVLAPLPVAPKVSERERREIRAKVAEVARRVRAA